MELGSAHITPEVLKALRRGADAEERRYAASVFLAEGSVAVPYLVSALYDPNSSPGYVVELLGRIGDSSAVPSICHLLVRRLDGDIAEICIAALQSFGHEAVVELCATLADPDCDVVRVARFLEERRDPWAIPALAGRLRVEQDATAADACLAALFAFGNDAHAELCSLLTTTCLHSARIINRLTAVGDVRAAAAFSARLRWETDPALANSCLAGLKQCGRDPVPELIQALNNSRSDPVMNAYVLGKIRDPRSLPALAQGARLHPNVRARGACLDALEKLGPASVPALCELLGHPRPDTVQVVRVLRAIGDPTAVPALLHRLARTDDPRTIVACLGAVAQLGDTSVVERLIESLSDPREGVAPAAATAIVALAERFPLREVGIAVRVMRGKLSLLRRVSEADRAVYRQAIERLEPMAATLGTLPVPASHHCRNEGLPLPAEQAD